METPRPAARFDLVLAIMLTAAMGACDAPSAPRAPGPGSASRDIRGSAEMSPLIAQVRNATAKYHNISVARADGYVDDGFGCVADPDLGGMGWHLIRDDLHADPAIDPLKPELLIYEPQKNGGMRLVAVEYEVFQADWANAGNTEPPSLFGRTFEALVFPGLDPVYGLHLWLWAPNAAGILEDFNPAIACP
jgi:hypothetical protein